MKKWCQWILMISCLMWTTSESFANGFVKVNKQTGRFELNGKPYDFAGTNLYWLMQKRAQMGPNWPGVSESLKMSKDLNFRVIRIWGFADGFQWTNPQDPAVLQRTPGVYNEVAFKALDSAIAEAGRLGLKVIVTFTNSWDEFGGIKQYLAWAGLPAQDKTKFFTDPKVHALVRNAITKIIMRRNTVNNLLYRDDPAIFSWELMNEARNSGDRSGNQILEWYKIMGSHVRSLDKNHMISTGEEGFDTTTQGYPSAITNGYIQTGAEGTSFVRNSSLPIIDYTCAHYYPEHWGLKDLVKDTEAFLKDRVLISNRLKKPFVLAEYGAHDWKIYQAWTNLAEKLGVRGTLIWGIYPESSGITGPFEVQYPKDRDISNILKGHAQDMNRR